MKQPTGFDRFVKDAEVLIEEQAAVQGLLQKVKVKAAVQKENLGKAGSQLSMMQRLVRSWSNGSYRRVPMQALLASVGGLLYFLVPTDAIPDFIFAAGYIDDIAVLGWVAGRFKKELGHFSTWEAEKREEFKGELVGD